MLSRAFALWSIASVVVSGRSLNSSVVAPLALPTRFEPLLPSADIAMILAAMSDEKAWVFGDAAEPTPPTIPCHQADGRTTIVITPPQDAPEKSASEAQPCAEAKENYWRDTMDTIHYGVYLSKELAEKYTQEIAPIRYSKLTQTQKQRFDEVALKVLSDSSQTAAGLPRGFPDGTVGLQGDPEEARTNIARAYKYVKKLVKRNADITPARMTEINSILRGQHYGVRNFDLWIPKVGSFAGPKLLPAILENIAERLNNRETNPIVEGLTLAQEGVGAHIWGDANGRTLQMCYLWRLLRADLPPVPLERKVLLSLGHYSELAPETASNFHLILNGSLKNERGGLVLRSFQLTPGNFFQAMQDPVTLEFFNHQNPDLVSNPAFSQHLQNRALIVHRAMQFFGECNPSLFAANRAAVFEANNSNNQGKYKSAIAQLRKLKHEECASFDVALGRSIEVDKVINAIRMFSASNLEYKKQNAKTIKKATALNEKGDYQAAIEQMQKLQHTEGNSFDVALEKATEEYAAATARAAAWETPRTWACPDNRDLSPSAQQGVNANRLGFGDLYRGSQRKHFAEIILTPTMENTLLAWHAITAPQASAEGMFAKTGTSAAAAPVEQAVEVPAVTASPQA